jgi:hypothetical protein
MQEKDNKNKNLKTFKNYVNEVISNIREKNMAKIR